MGQPDQVVDAAAEMIAVVGWRHLTVTAVARHAGVDPAGLPDAVELALEVLGRELASVPLPTPTAATWRSDLVGYLEGVARLFTGGYDSLLDLWATATLAVGEPHLRYADAIISCLTAGGAPNPGCGAEMVHAAFVGWMLSATGNRRFIDEDATVRRLSEVGMRLLQRRHPATAAVEPMFSARYNSYIDGDPALFMVLLGCIVDAAVTVPPHQPPVL